ncbi:MAG TPA: 3-oxoacyl-ACP reductase FabG [Candidatus Cottocaccamicrobium excrementipullorum]|nr:3-oxoacyl-ACP reductase FabG [Candidatus Cottocaccamicrobium excrementipullorum]
MGNGRKTVLITGGSRGIGRAAALHFAKEGWQVVITAHKSQNLLWETKKEIQAMGASCLAFLGDVGSMADCRRLFSQIKETFGDLDVLVNNAGISYIGLFQDMTEEEWDRMIRTDLTSVFYCCKLAVPGMIHRRQGKIINVSSVWGVCGASCEAAYSAAKGGVNAFSRALAKELAPSNIQVNALALGAMDTEMNQWMEEEERNALQAEIPAGRMGKPEEAAEMIFSLATSPDYLTGQIIQFDGGWI